MGRGATKAAGNVYYQARIEAAKWNDRLCSREGAAEALGVSIDTVKNIELGLHKCLPVDLVVLMADLYNAPYLLCVYCKNECPIGCNYPIATAMTPVERTTLKLINLLDPGKLEDVKRELISIAEDGEITEDEIPSLKEILDYADKLILAATELKMLGSQVMTECVEVFTSSEAQQISGEGRMKMIVWVATHYWENEVNEGSEVLGVFKNHDRAYKEIENAADTERKTESDDFWDSDCTWAEGDEIHLGHPSKNFADCNVEHVFKVTLHNVNEEI